MRRISSPQRYKAGRRALALEPLEVRRLLSGVSGTTWTGYGPYLPSWQGDVSSGAGGSGVSTQADPSSGSVDLNSVGAPRDVIATLPADGSSLAESPDSLVINFPQQADFLWQDGAVQLVRVDDQGSLIPIFDPNFPPVASFDPSGMQATIPLNQPLAAGHYQILLKGSNDLSDFLSGGTWDTSIDQPLADFTVVKRGVTLPDATDLGTIGSQVLTVPGNLDLSTSQDNVALYRITLAQGHTWRLGLQLDAARIGSGLLGALSLFDSFGRLIAARDAGTGRLDFPNDPYLFAGLAPGVYYVGVSGGGNVPGRAGGYDPASGTIGTAGLRQPGGSFVLEVVADVADAPTRVTGFTLNRDDPNSTSPTGITLAFSGPLDAASILGDGTGQTAVVAIDQSGRTWSLTPVGYSETQAQISFNFDQALPPGRYTLRIPSSGGLTDLAGKSPTAAGLPSGVLASWAVTAPRRSTLTNDLGTLRPSLADGLSRKITIAPGQTVVYRVVIPLSGFVKLAINATGGGLGIRRVGADGMAVLDSGTSSQLNSYIMDLGKGIYAFAFTAVGSRPVQLEWRLGFQSLDPESLIDNGVGQSAALSLRLISPTSSSLSGASQASSDLAFAGNAVGPPTSSTGPSVVSPIPASLLVTVNTGLLGRPSSQSETVAAVGPVVSGGFVAMADLSPGLLPGLLDRPYRAVIVPESGDAKPATTEGTPVVEASATGKADGDAVRTSGVGDPDAMAIAQVDRIAGLVARLGRWFAGSESPEASTPEEERSTAPSAADGEPSQLLASLQKQDAGDPRSDRVEHAELGVPTTLVITSAAAYRLRQFASGWWRRAHKRALGPRPDARRCGPGPHAFRRKPKPAVGAPSIRGN